MLSSQEIERRLIGGVLRHPHKIHEIRDAIESDQFADDLMREIWRVMEELAIEGVTIDRAIVARRTPSPPTITLPVLLSKLQAEAGDEAAVLDYAREFADAAMRRKARALFEAGKEMMERVPNARAALMQLQGEITTIVGHNQTGETHAGSLADAIVSSSQSTKRVRSIKTGLPFFDDIFGNLIGGNLIILGGATSSGKSALAGQIAHNVAKRALIADSESPEERLGCPVLYITLEMEGKEIIERLLSQETEIRVEDIESGALNVEQQYKLEYARREMQGLPLYIEDLPRATVATLVALAMKHIKLHGAGLVIVDHLHYLRGSNRRMDRFAQIEEVVLDLKAAAKQTRVPWLCLSHLSRDIAKRPDKRPHLTDLYGASEIEKSGDVVGFVHRPQYWMEREAPPKKGTELRKAWDDDYALWMDRAELIVEKRRKGKGVASRKCIFESDFTIFKDLKGGE